LIGDGETGIITFDISSISAAKLTALYSRLFNPNIKVRVERIENFLLVTIPSGIHGNAASSLRDAITTAIRVELEGVDNPYQRISFISIRNGRI
jgi:hypothetical protein